LISFRDFLFVLPVHYRATFHRRFIERLLEMTDARPTYAGPFSHSDGVEHEDCP